MRRHAQARTLRIDMRYGLRACTITIADDGRGIDPAHRAGRMGHWGLAGMRERAALLKGRLDIDTGPGGTTVRLRVKHHKT